MLPPARELNSRGPEGSEIPQNGGSFLRSLPGGARKALFRDFGPFWGSGRRPGGSKRGHFGGSGGGLTFGPILLKKVIKRREGGGLEERSEP